MLTSLWARSDTELQIVAAGAALVTRYGSVVDQIRETFGEVVEVPSVVEGGGRRESAVSTGLLLTQMAGVLERLRPHVVVTVADRHETLATAVAASYQNIPLCHLQGGEESGSIDDKVRNAVTQLADLHCVATDTAASRVWAMRPGAEVHTTGCPGVDIAACALERGPLPGKDIVVLQHPDTDEAEDAASQMSETLDAIRPFAERALWFWPGEDAGSEGMSKELRLAGVRPVRNMDPGTFLRTLMGSGVLVGNSSVGIRECSFLGVPVVNVGRRQIGRERGPNVADVGYDSGSIRGAVVAMMGKHCAPTTLYGDGKAGQRIAALLARGVVERAA